MGLIIKFARTDSEVTKSIQLASKIFYPQLQQSEACSLHKKMLSYCENISNDYILSIGENGKIYGMCVLKNRDMYFNNSKIQATFLSSICIDEPYRGKGYSKLLIRSALDECKVRGSDISVVIARRAVDFYYTQFGFWGLARYSSIDINMKSTKYSRITESVKSNIKYLPAIVNDLSLISNLYENVYPSLLGAFVRELEFWRYIYRKCELLDFKFVKFIKDEKIVGYSIYSECTVYEIAVSCDVCYMDCLVLICDPNSINTATIQASSEHPVVNELWMYDFKIVDRQCVYGGHMVKNMDEHRLENTTSIMKSIEKPLFDSKNVSYQTRGTFKNHVQYSEKLNIEEYRRTSRILNATHLSPKKDIECRGVERKFNIPYFDQI